ncbi:MAG: preprotein translocase subunit YajC [Spirochaetaceae bacterium]|nr:preprotein translocase subunit YajC [Spirochaetaceae bacterium]
MISLLTLLGTLGTTGSSAGTSGSMATSLITFALIIVIMYFLIIRPQRKKDKDAKALVNSVAKGDKVVTIGGIHGTVVAVREKTVVVKVDDNSRIEFTKGAISTVISKKGAVKPSAKKKSKAVAIEAKEETDDEVSVETTDESDKKNK